MLISQGLTESPAGHFELLHLAPLVVHGNAERLRLVTRAIHLAGLIAHHEPGRRGQGAAGRGRYHKWTRPIFARLRGGSPARHASRGLGQAASGRVRGASVAPNGNRTTSHTITATIWNHGVDLVENLRLGY